MTPELTATAVRLAGMLKCDPAELPAKLAALGFPDRFEEFLADFGALLAAEDGPDVECDARTGSGS